MTRVAGHDGRQWEPVRTFGQRWEAELVEGVLASEGFDTWLVESGGGGHVYEIGTAGPLALLVPTESLAGARQLVASGGVPGDGDQDEDVREEMVARLFALLAIGSVTGEEEALADWVCERYERRGEQIRRVGDSVIVGDEDFERPNVLLVGHLDTVPPTEYDDGVPERTSASVVGRGASDMKSGLAVAMSCFEDPALRAGPNNVLLVCYAGEEGPHEGNQLRDLLDTHPDLSDADLAVVLEPTDLAVQLGCLGGLHAELLFRGRAAHSARPWQGENALTKAGSVLATLHEQGPNDVDVDGLTYREVMTATWGTTGDGARNVVPDEFVVNLNYRYAPHRRLTEAEEAVWSLVGGLAEVVVVDRSPPAPPGRENRHVAAFVEAIGGTVEAKQAWTDVARFAEVGVPALNYGPGLTAQAHQDGEHVPIANLVAARAGLGRFLSGAGDA